jgi:hypothetical protein
MNTKEKFQEMIAYDFSNLNLKQGGNDNCFSACDDGCFCHCDSGDCDRDL